MLQRETSIISARNAQKMRRHMFPLNSAQLLSTHEITCSTEVQRIICLAVKFSTSSLYVLFYADNGHLDIVKTLVQAGSDRHVLDGEGRTPLNCAQGPGPGEARTSYPMAVTYLQ